ncbi:LppM family (lipo)protein [Pseudolysinimonas yzui]|uniref:LppM domain-containing protein n=1 Tax=Pseudolysinimonas yzui TaxID=2708254 RepID=A0A8J3GSE4_9MICO|nr:hypothetical protein [Pseudolysinimonas yzui]GHF25191.1 hypothetical protein GCM10011600_27850 [Pseudolysinimonas yzui]
MKRRILPRILAVGVLVLALAGCVRFQADLTLNPEDTVDGSIVVAVLVSEDTDEAREQSLTAADQIEADLLGSLRDASGVTTSAYEEDDYIGSRIVFDDVALDAFSGQSEDSLRIVRDGDEYLFTGALDFSGESIPSEEPVEGDDNLTVSVTFPGEVTEHNGELTGTTVSWSTAVDQRLEMSARGSATPAGPPILLIVGIALVVLLVIAAVVAVLLFVRSRAKKNAAVTAVPGADAAAVPAPAAAPAAEAPPAAPVVEAPPAAETPAPKTPRAPKTPKAPPTGEA